MIKILAATAALFIGIHAAQSAEPVKIRMGWVVAPGSVATLLTMKPDLSVHRDKTYSFEPIHFVSTAVELVPLASGQLDIVDISYSAIGAAIENAHLASDRSAHFRRRNPERRRRP